MQRSPGPESQRVRYITKTQYFRRAELEAQSPSLKDGVPATKESAFRKACVRLITDVTQRLKLPQWVLWTAAVFCNRFYAVRSYVKNDRFYLASAAVLLASKVEECPRPLHDVALASYTHRISVSKMEDQAAMRQNLYSKSFMEELQQSLLLAERALLYTLGFNLTVDQPTPVLSRLARDAGLAVTRDEDASKQGRQTMQCVINFINDSAKTTLCLQYPAATLVITFIHISAKLHKFKLAEKDGLSFIEWACCKHSVAPEHLSDIESQIMELYDTRALAPPAQGTSAPTPQQSGAPGTAAVAAATQPSGMTQATGVLQGASGARQVAPNGAGLSGDATSSPEEGELPGSDSQQQQQEPTLAGSLSQPAGAVGSAKQDHPAGRASSGALGVSSGKLEDSANEEDEGTAADDSVRQDQAEAISHPRVATGEAPVHLDGGDAAALLTNSKKRKLEDDLSGPDHKRLTNGSAHTAVHVQ